MKGEQPVQLLIVLFAGAVLFFGGYFLGKLDGRLDEIQNQNERVKHERNE